MENEIPVDARLMDREIMAVALNIRADDPSWSGKFSDDAYVKIARAAEAKAWQAGRDSRHSAGCFH